MLRAGPFRSKVAATAAWVTRHYHRQSIRDSHHQKLSLHIPSFHSIASLTFDLNRIIDNNFDLFYLTNHLKARNSSFLVLTLHITLRTDILSLSQQKLC